MNWLSGSNGRHTGREMVGIIAARLGLLMAALMLAGCSALGLAYQQLPNLSYWWLDDYFDFNSSQSEQVRNALDQVAAWHKHNQLTPYAELLQQASGLAVNGFSAEQVCQWQDAASQHINALAEQVVPLAVPVLVTLTPAQLKHFETYIAKRNEDWQDEQLRVSAQAQLAFRLERSLKQIERFYGSISAAQQEQVAAVLAQSDYQAEQAFERRLSNQAQLLQWLRNVNNLPSHMHAQQAQALLDIWQRSMQWPASRRARWCQQWVDFHAIMTPAQRQTASETLAAYAKDLKALGGS